MFLHICFSSHKFQVHINNSHNFMLYYCQPFNSAYIIQVFDDLFTSASLVIRVVISFRDCLHFKTSSCTGIPAGLKLQFFLGWSGAY